MQVQQKSYTQKFQQQSYNKLSSLTTYYSSKLINKTIILFVLSPPLFKKMFFLSLFLSSLSFLSFLPIRIFFFFLSSSSLFSSPLLWSFSLYFFFFSFFFFPSLFLSSIQCFFLFSFFPSLFSPILFPFHQWIMVVVDHGS